MIAVRLAKTGVTDSKYNGIEVNSKVVKKGLIPDINKRLKILI